MPRLRKNKLPKKPHNEAVFAIPSFTGLRPYKNNLLNKIHFIMQDKLFLKQKARRWFVFKPSP